MLPNLDRRSLLGVTAGFAGASLPGFLAARANASTTTAPKAKFCIIIYCWGGMSHIDTFDPKPLAPVEVRGQFAPIATATPGITVTEHLPHLAQQTEKLAIVRSIHHDDSAHGRGMYWNLTGHKPPRVGNIAPERADWPSLPAMTSVFREAPKGVPRAIRLPYPMVDNGTLQAGEYGGFLGGQFDPIVIKTPAGTPFGGVSRSLGTGVLELGQVDTARLRARGALKSQLAQPIGQQKDFTHFDHFHDLAQDILLSTNVKHAYDLDREDPAIRETYGPHIGGQSLLLARRLTEAGVPIVQVCCAAGDLNGSVGDMWDTHGDNFNRLKHKLLPVFDRGTAALLTDLEQRGTLDETLIVMLTDFGRTPRVNGGAGRDHYPNAYTVFLAGAGIQGGQIYGSTTKDGAHPKDNPCGPPDIHATIFQQLGISPRAEIHDQLGRPFPICDGKALPLT